MNLTKLQKEAHAIAKLKGWWDTERTFGDCIALVHSELSEALEAYRERGDWDNWCELHTDVNGKPIGVGSELADMVIRVADMAEWYGYDLSKAEEKKPFFYFEPSVLSFGYRIALLHALAADAFRHEGSEAPIEDCLATLIAGVSDIAAHYGIDLDAAIAAKMEYNKTRSYRHGGKAL